MWSVLFTEEVRDRLVSEKNRKEEIKKLYLELTGMLLGQLVLEAVTPDPNHCHIGMFCDNNTTVVWENRLSSKCSMEAGRLLRMLSLQKRRAQVSPLLTLSIAGDKNDMADVVLRAFWCDK